MGTRRGQVRGSGPCTALHCTAPAVRCSALRCAALRCTALHCTALQYAVVYHTAEEARAFNRHALLSSSAPGSSTLCSSMCSEYCAKAKAGHHHLTLIPSYTYTRRDTTITPRRGTIVSGWPPLGYGQKGKIRYRCKTRKNGLRRCRQKTGEGVRVRVTTPDASLGDPASSVAKRGVPSCC